MVIRWEEPLAPTKAPIFTREVMEELRSRPGEWAVLREYPKYTSRNHHHIYAPKGFQTCWRMENNHRVLYGRFVP